MGKELIDIDLSQNVKIGIYKEVIDYIAKKIENSIILFTKGLVKNEF